MSENQDKRGDEASTQLHEERGLPSVNGRRGRSKFSNYIGIAALVGVVAVMAWLQLAPKADPKEDKEEVSELRRGLPALDLGAEPPPLPAATAVETKPAGVAQVTPAPATTGIQQQQPRKPTEAELLLERRKRAPILAFTGGMTAGTQEKGAHAAAAGQPTLDGDPEGGIGEQLQATRTEMVGATMLSNRNYLIAKGTFLDCALITALDSTLPGMTSCRLTRNIYSDNGKVLLLERGSIVEGEYRGGQMRQGMKRIFVLWTRVRTPNGVAVRLDSPGTDELGRSGLSGWVDTHFWTRFGGALLLSLVDSGTDYLIEKQRSSGQGSGDSFSFESSGNATQQAAAIALQNSINIPPTLNKNQGDLINIYVARDMDFRGVYALRSQ